MNVMRPVGQAVKTSPSHGENSGSIPLRAVAYKSIQLNKYGSLVKRLRRRPLTAKTAVRFRYELLTKSIEDESFQCFFYLLGKP